MKTYHIDKWFRQTFGRINNLNWTCWMICLWTLMLHPLHVCAYLSQVHHSNSKPRLFNLDYNHANQLIISSQVIFSFFPEHSPNYCHLYPIQTRKSVRLVGVLLFRSPSTFIILPVTAPFLIASTCIFYIIFSLVSSEKKIGSHSKNSSTSHMVLQPHCHRQKEFHMHIFQWTLVTSKLLHFRSCHAPPP
jgi:hypothetical protein